MKYFETYLGDGAYAYMNDARQVILYTSAGITETNRVALEPEVLASFEKWAASLPEKIERLRTAHATKPEPA
jgi:hypothetical protein